jgi:glutaredoxin 3
VLIYSGPGCPYCTRAKRLLQERRVPFEEIDVVADPEQRAAMIRASGRRTIPQIFIDGEPIGGFEELASLDRRGELVALAGPGGEATK